MTIKELLQKIINIFSPSVRKDMRVFNAMDPEFFTFKELVFSQTAKDKGIDNIPDWPVIENLKYLGKVLDDFRNYWNKPVRVTSGYRCHELNKLVGGVGNSSHKQGLAADIQPQDMKDWDAFKKAAVEFFENYEHDFDQVIIEKSKNTQWLHIGIAGNRRQIFKLEA